MANENEPNKTFNSYYINIVKYATGKILTNIGSSTSNKDESEVVKKLIKKYKNHSSISIIRNSIYVEEKFKYQFGNSHRI